MRKIFSTRLLLFMFFVLMIAACKKDGLRSKELLVYIPAEFGSVNNTITASLIRTPLSVWGSMNYDVTVSATREVPVDVEVFLKADTSVAAFNTANQTNYLLLPAAAYKFGGNSKTIAAGKQSTDPIRIEITDPASLADTRGYILPISIDKISTKDKGVQISSNQSTVYLVIPYRYTNIDSVQTVLAGPMMSRTGWTVTVSNSSSGTANQASNLLDGNDATVWRSSNSATAAKTITLNMGTTQTIKGFRISPNYNNVNENATEITVSTSTDNVTYTPQGVWRGTAPAVGSSAAAPDYKGVNFLAPVQARYFRLDITARVSGNIVGAAEIHAIQ